MNLVFADRAWEDDLHWQANDPNALDRLNGLIRECMHSAFKGTGRPEPLRGDLQGWWSRPITLENRLVYRVSGKAEARRLEIAQCGFRHIMATATP